jgi:hypothetical protein
MPIKLSPHRMAHFKLTAAWPVKEFPTITQPEGSLLCSHEATIHVLNHINPVKTSHRAGYGTPLPLPVHCLSRV